MSAPTHRSRPKPQGDETAGAQLQLGEFQNVPTLTLSEARLLMSAVNAARLEKQGRALEDNPIFKKSLDYLNLFSRFKDTEEIKAIEHILAQRVELDPFEKTQLANLNLVTNKDSDYDPVQEAKALIPSIDKKIKDQDLRDLIEELDKLKRRGG